MEAWQRPSTQYLASDSGERSEREEPGHTLCLATGSGSSQMDESCAARQRLRAGQMMMLMMIITIIIIIIIIIIIYYTLFIPCEITTINFFSLVYI